MLAKAAMSFIPDTTGEATIMGVAGAATKPLLFAGAAASKTLLFTGKKAFNYGAKALGYNATTSGAKLAYGAVGEGVAGAAGKLSGNAYVQPKIPANTGKLTKGQIVDYLQNVDKILLEQLTEDILRIGKDNLKLYNPELIEKCGIYKFKYTNKDTGVAKIFIEIHKAKGPKDFHHMHITDRFGNVYDKHLNNLTAKFSKENPSWHENKVKTFVGKLPEAHIKIKEFVELKMRP